MTNNTYNPNPFREPQRRSTLIVVIIVLVLIALGVGAAVFFSVGRFMKELPLATAPGVTTVVITPRPTAAPVSTVTATATATIVRSSIATPTTVTLPAPALTPSTSTGGGVCDGRYILIVHSVLATPSTYPQEEIATALATYPGAQVGEPGFCSSIRGQVDGQIIYPIFFDYGHNAADACAGKTRYGGNVRTLNNTGDFSAPC